MTEPNRAQNVCEACNVRKKACDKVLPACSFCADRGLSCKYDTNVARKRGRRLYNPGRNFVAVGSLLSLDTASQAKPVEEHLQIQKPLLPPLQLQGRPTPQDITGSLSQQIHHVFELLNLTSDAISDHYFRSYHQWVPVVSPEYFRHAGIKYKEEDDLPPADYSLLLLAMCLITTLPSLGNVSPSPTLNRRSLYDLTKSMFSQVQAISCTTVALVQAALIIAKCEYVCVRPKAAYITLSTCISMALVLEEGGESSNSSASDTAVTQAQIERVRIRWAVTMLERIILSGMEKQNLVPQTECLGPEYEESFLGIPLAEPIKNLTQRTTDVSRLTKPIALPCWESIAMRRQVQAISILDQVLHFCHTAAETGQCRFEKLANLDSEIRHLLVTVIGEDKDGTRPMRIAIALCVRSLFLLHETAVSTTRAHPKSDDPIRQFSLAALNTACEMVIDAASFGQQRTGTMPICCYYNLQAAINRLEERIRCVSIEDLAKSLELLLRSAQGYSGRWEF